MITRISHITFVVKDLDRSADFFVQIFDAKEVYSSRAEKYFLIGDLWIALNKGEPLTERTYNHIAFQVSKEEWEQYNAN